MLVATLVGGLATGLVVLTILGGTVGSLASFIGFLGLMRVAFVALGVGISAGSASECCATASPSVPT
jgi:ABC-2 type transport system permease protein